MARRLARQSLAASRNRCERRHRGLETVRSGRLPFPSSLPPAASILTVHPMRRPVLLRMISLDHPLQYADALPQRPRDWSLKDLSRVRMPT